MLHVLLTREGFCVLRGFMLTRIQRRFPFHNFPFSRTCSGCAAAQPGTARR
jgi:hypothetical protein